MNGASLNEIKDANPIRKVAIELGAELRHDRSLCLFHSEKTPSLTFYDDHYFCFGCHAGGDVISFVMRVLNLSFPTALRWLCRRAGLPQSSGRCETALERAARLRAETKCEAERQEEESFSWWERERWDALLRGHRERFQMTGHWTSCLEDSHRMGSKAPPGTRKEIEDSLQRCYRLEQFTERDLLYWDGLSQDERRELWKAYSSTSGAEAESGDG